MPFFPQQASSRSFSAIAGNRHKNGSIWPGGLPDLELLLRLRTLPPHRQCPCPPRSYFLHPFRRNSPKILILAPCRLRPLRPPPEEAPPPTIPSHPRILNNSSPSPVIPNGIRHCRTISTEYSTVDQALGEASVTVLLSPAAISSSPMSPAP
jgi:hypothetical protein